MGCRAALTVALVGVVIVSTGNADSAEPSCPGDMVEVSGDYCPRVEQTCLRWLDPDNPGVNGPVQCAEFGPSKCLSDKLVAKRFCIDRYEWPNRVGELPAVQMSWLELRDACSAAGKRLCAGSEFTFACEGPSIKPYPYGYQRDASACNIDKKWIDPFTTVLKRKPDGSTERVPAEKPLAEVDQREKIGSHPQCVSDFGAYDLTGNADEWVVNESGKPYESGLKGGHWATGARNRCRPMTDAHNPPFKFYVTGGRCCKDAR